jgi:hypothetical protein
LLFKKRFACVAERLVTTPTSGCKTPSVIYGGDYVKGRSAGYITYTLANTFDAVIYIRETTAARDMQ